MTPLCLWIPKETLSRRFIHKHRLEYIVKTIRLSIFLSASEIATTNEQVHGSFIVSYYRYVFIVTIVRDNKTHFSLEKRKYEKSVPGNMIISIFSKFATVNHSS